MKKLNQIISFLTIITLTIILTFSCSNEQKKGQNDSNNLNNSNKLLGKWKITTEPKWVDDVFLAYKSKIYEFTNDGTCIFGTAGGDYKVIGNSKIKVNFPIQSATAGYVGILTYKIVNKQLILISSNETEPIILERQ